LKDKIDDGVKKPLTLFEHLDNLTKNKIEYNVNDCLQTKNYNQYRINRFVSMCDLYIPLVNEINKYSLPDDVHYNFYLKSLPKRKQFFKYISKIKDNLIESKKNIAKYFECSLREAEEYSYILTKKQIDEINKKFDGGKKC
jgi:hypothetical protein